MKGTSKLFLLLAAVGMLVGCKAKPSKSSSSTPSSTANDINVVYIKSYVSDARAEQMKTAYIESLKTAGVTVDEAKINFFSTENSTVAAYADEILSYNEANPTNPIDAILGARSFDNAEEESRNAILEKYETDNVDYKYGTHSKDENKYNRRFFYDKAKKEDTFVKGLHSYLQANWTEYIPPEPVDTGKLTVMVYGTFVSAARLNEIKTGFNAYLTAKEKTISNLVFEHETTTSTISAFMDEVDKYDEAHADAKVDVLLGLKTNSAITSRGFNTDSQDYNYGDKEGDETGNKERRFWYKEYTTEVKLLQSYLRANWAEPEFYLVGSMNSWNLEDTTYHFTKVDANTYTLAGFQAEAATEVKVYCPFKETLYNNATTPTDCGYTIGAAPDYNVIITDAGKYTITFKVTEANNNHISLEKQLLPTFRIGFYNKGISDENITKMWTEIQAAFVTAGLDEQYTLAKTELGTGNYTSMAGNLVAGTQVILGANNASACVDAIGETYEHYSDQTYTYGKDTSRLMWILKGTKTDAGVIAVYNYLQANWLPEA